MNRNEWTLTYDPYESMLEGLRIMKTYLPKITNVIFNDPATIVFWADNTKTVVKCQEGDVFDPEKGLTMAIVKKAYGNKGSYCNEIKKWCEPCWQKMAEERENYFKQMVLAMQRYCDQHEDGEKEDC